MTAVQQKIAQPIATCVTSLGASFPQKQVRQIALSGELVVNDGGFLGIPQWKGLSLGNMPRIGSTTNINHQHPLNERRNHMVTPPQV